MLRAKIIGAWVIAVVEVFLPQVSLISVIRSTGSGGGIDLYCQRTLI